MYPALVIRCNDEKTVKEIMLLLQRELRIRDYVVEVPSEETRIEEMDEVVENLGRIQMLVIDPATDDER